MVLSAIKEFIGHIRTGINRVMTWLDRLYLEEVILANFVAWVMLYITMQIYSSIHFIPLTVIVFFSLNYFWKYRRSLYHRILFLRRPLHLIAGIVLVWFISANLEVHAGYRNGGEFLEYYFYGLAICVNVIIFIEERHRLFLASQGKKIRFPVLRSKNKLIMEEILNTNQKVEQEVVQRLKAEKLRTELITNISHDVKTPLTSILSFSDLMSQEPLPETALDYLRVIQKSAHRMDVLVSDLFTATKSATGNMELDLGPVDVSELLMQTYAPLDSNFQEVNLEMIYNQRDEPLPVMADGTQLSRVFQNLLVNAMKYSVPYTRLYINAKTVENAVYIDFVNISRDQLNISANELMEQFVRGDKSRRTEGSGLGLYIATNLMRAMGGWLKLIVEGDVFTARLKLVAAPSETLGREKEASQDTVVLPRGFSRPTGSPLSQT